jgi:glutaredoxin 3
VETELAEVEIYTSPFCGYCTRAKALLDKKGVPYTEHNVMMKPDLRAEMSARAGGKTSVPQIFIDGKNIGGCDELFELDFDDELDPMLGIED